MKDHPIVKCLTFEEYTEAITQLFKYINSVDRIQFFTRCKRYELDQNRKEELQIFDMPFNEYATLTNAGI